MAEQVNKKGPAIHPPKADELLDMAIIGGGIAGATAGIYSGRYLLKTALFTKTKGGAILDSPDVENYPGFITISGYDLMNRVLEQAQHYGTLVVNEIIEGIEKQDDVFILKGSSGKSYKTKQVIIATGLIRRKLGLPKEDKLSGKGVSYCATCDGFFYKDKIVGVVGGSDAAALSAMLLSKYASKVYVIYRRERMRCEPYWLTILEDDPKVEFNYNANVAELKGEEKLEGVKLDNGNELKLDGLFIEIGSEPSTDLFAPLGVEVDKRGYVKVDDGMKTNIPRIYAAGDLTTGSAGFKQLVVGAAEGAIAATSAYHYAKKELKDTR
jgi:thioredoxin reductase (NADPH)